MAARLPPDLLQRSAQESSRLLALSYLDQIDSARTRLGDASDENALHDFRVGLRRLRSAVRAYRGELEGSIGPKMRRRVRDLARATNEGRDLEVQLAWLARVPDRLSEGDVPGYFWLVGRLEDRKQTTQDHSVADVARRYEKAAAKLRRALGVLRIELPTAAGQRPPTFREVTGALVRRQVASVRQELSRIQGAVDPDQPHRTRISLKRLRYLIEPVARGNRRAGALVRRLKEAQDLLGEYHDMHVLSCSIASFRGGLSSGKFSGLEPGLITLSLLAEDGATAAFEKFEAVWRGELGNRILARAEQLGELLEQGPAGEPMPAGPAPAAESARSAASARNVESAREEESTPIGEEESARTHQEESLQPATYS